VYRAHWQGHREIAVRVTPDEIVIRRSGASTAAGDDDDAR
jgi:hypothetical protein